jgi:hypothetical protein
MYATHTAFSVNPNGYLIGTANYGGTNGAEVQGAPYQIMVRATDTQSVAAQSNTFTLDIQAACPVKKNPISNLQGTEAVMLSPAIVFSPTFYDADGFSLAYTLQGLPAGSGLTFTATTATLSGTPAATLAGQTISLIICADNAQTECTPVCYSSQLSIAAAIIPCSLNTGTCPADKNCFVNSGTTPTTINTPTYMYYNFYPYCT